MQQEAELKESYVESLLKMQGSQFQRNGNKGGWGIMHEHIQALLMFEINKKLEELQRRGVGYIDCEYTGGINYKIDDTVYEITIKEKGGAE